MEGRKPWATKAEIEPLERKACDVLDVLRKEHFPIWKAKKVLELAIELLECEELREKE